MIIKIYLSCISSLFLSIIVISTKEKVLNTYPPLFNTSLVGLVQQAGYFFDFIGKSASYEIKKCSAGIALRRCGIMLLSSPPQAENSAEQKFFLVNISRRKRAAILM